MYLYVQLHILNILVVIMLSGILFAKQKLGVIFISDKQEVIDFTKFKKITMCSGVVTMVTKFDSQLTNDKY
jgi:hypothetical protein